MTFSYAFLQLVLVLECSKVPKKILEERYLQGRHKPSTEATLSGPLRKNRGVSFNLCPASMIIL